MTPEEIYAEIRKDRFWIIETMELFQKSFGRLVLKSNTYPIPHIYGKVSKKTNIEYGFLFFAYRRSQWKCPKIVVFTRYAHEIGKTCIVIRPDETITIYTDHFLKRYLQREVFSELTIDAWNNIASELKFIARNVDAQRMEVRENFFRSIKDDKITQEQEKFEWMKFQASPGYERVEYACRDGVCLCEQNIKLPKIIIFNTFVGFDQLRLDQGIDYMIAYSHIHLRKMEEVYPNQKSTWAAMWNDFMDHMTETQSVEDWLERYQKVMLEFEDKYPLPALL